VWYPRVGLWKDIGGEERREGLRDRNRHHRSIKEATTVYLMRFHSFRTKNRAGNGSGAVVGVADISRREIEMGEVEVG